MLELLSVSQQVNRILRGQEDMSVEAFMSFIKEPIPIDRVYSPSSRQRRVLKQCHFKTNGVYILVNTTQDKVYVGWGEDLQSEIYHQFTGCGLDVMVTPVYGEYCNGDLFNIKMIAINRTRFKRSELLNDVVSYYNARHIPVSLLSQNDGVVW